MYNTDKMEEVVQRYISTMGTEVLVLSGNRKLMGRDNDVFVDVNGNEWESVYIESAIYAVKKEG